MNTNILWTGIEYHSLEDCIIKTTETGSEISSTIIGYYEGKIYKVAYQICTNKNWETMLFEINCRHNNNTQFIKFENDGKGNWLNNGERDDRFDSCTDVDIPLTPFTNTLPIRRLQLRQNQSQEISVIYCDLLASDMRSVKQKYTCISNSEYHYENVPNDFEVKIQVDEEGLVIDYPLLFTRTAKEIIIPD